MSSPADSWLTQWRAAAPPSLAAIVETAIATSAGAAGDIVTALSDAGIACLRTALRIGDDRAAALPLLAADALITAACDAAVGTERGLDDLVTRFSAEQLGAEFKEELSAGPS